MKPFRIEIKWALIFAVMTMAWMYMEKLLGWHDQKIADHASLTNFVAIPAIALYVFALLDKRKNYYGGHMSYAQGFMTGLIMTAIVTILSPLTQYIVSTYITPSYFPNAIRHAVETNAMSEENANEYFSLSNYIMQGLIGAPVMGLLTTLIVAIFTRKK
ncbi:MAG: DUF4199 domain-containing protein [Chitinophagaceae bacterium]|jgi:hypothetical protein|nr:DUF4199 domain-containing protein [Chitinophagaceae bacterium]